MEDINIELLDTLKMVKEHLDYWGLYEHSKNPLMKEIVSAVIERANNKLNNIEE